MQTQKIFFLPIYINNTETSNDDANAMKTSITTTTDRYDNYDNKKRDNIADHTSHCAQVESEVHRCTPSLMMEAGWDRVE